MIIYIFDNSLLQSSLHIYGCSICAITILQASYLYSKVTVAKSNNEESITKYRNLNKEENNS